MNKTSGSGYSPDWIAAADRDWNRVLLLLQHDDAEGAAFHLQQSLEKYFKGFLLSKNWTLKKIHDLEILLDDAIQFDSRLESFRSLCERISNYYFSQRYPPLLDLGFSAEDVKQEVQAAEALRDILRQ